MTSLVTTAGDNKHRLDIEDSYNDVTKRIKLASLMQQFEDIGSIIMNRKPGGSGIVFENRWRSHFGASSVVCADVWERLDPHSLPAGSKMEHLLWALMLLKMYETYVVRWLEAWTSRLGASRVGPLSRLSPSSNPMS